MAPIPAKREKRIVGTSLKMYFDLPSTLEYVSAVAALGGAAAAAHVDLFVVPDFVALAGARERLSDTGVQLGAQNCFWEERGAFTGEVSARTLAQAGARYVELGHAERRRLFGETDADVARKAAAAARSGLVPLVCIGERQRGGSGSSGASVSHAVGLALDECRPQVQAALSLLPDDAEVVFAYEPVWAIGAAEPAGADHVVAVTQSLRALFAGRPGLTRILYGGSAGPGTFQKLKDGVDGLFLGRFAHDVKNLEKVLQEMSET